MTAPEAFATAVTPAAPIETDAVVIGAGPVGLFQVFELGLLDIRAHVIDSLPQAGGQCIELYPDKPIYDIPALPVSTGRELVDRLLKQIEPFHTPFHLGQEVTALSRAEDGRFQLETQTGQRFIAKAVFVAGGVGSFQPRQLKIGGLDAHKQSQFFYQVDSPARFAGQHLVISGGGDSALEWAIRFAAPGPHRARSVTLLHRRDGGFTATPERVARMRALCDAGDITLAVGQIIGIEEHEGRLTGVVVLGNDSTVRTLKLDSLLVLLGLSPRLGPIADWGFELERKQIVVDTEKFETAIPGVFAVGDVNTYPGKKKLILCGFHEATLAAFAAAPYVFPDQRVQLQYTTTSPKLHKLLGVSVDIEPTHALMVRT